MVIACALAGGFPAAAPAGVLAPDIAVPVITPLPVDPPQVVRDTVGEVSRTAGGVAAAATGAATQAADGAAATTQAATAAPTAATTPPSDARDDGATGPPTAPQSSAPAAPTPAGNAPAPRSSRPQPARTARRTTARAATPRAARVTARRGARPTARRVAHPARRTRPRAAIHAAAPAPRRSAAPRPHGVVDRIARSAARLVDHVPDWSRPIIALLLALVVALGLRAFFSGRRARRLEGTGRALRSDLEVLQAALVPKLPDRVGTTALSVAYRPADGLASGGDFYDAFALDAARTAIVLGDVSGHDRHAIARAAAVRHKLRAYLELGLEPRAVLRAAGDALASDSADGEFATAVVAVHDARAGTLTYACAGHPPPILIGAAAHDPVLVGSSAPLGWGLPTGRRQTTVSLGAREAAWFFTDGLLEARRDGAFLDREGLAAIVGRLAEDAGASELLAAVGDVAVATGDDLAALSVRSTAPAASPAVRIEEVEFDGRDIARKQPQRFLAACDAPVAAIEALAELTEAGPLVLRVRIDGAAVSVTTEHAGAAPRQRAQAR